MSGIAAFNIPGTTKSYFFKGAKYVKIIWNNAQDGDTIDYGPDGFVNTWHSLKAAGFPHIDAVLPIPSPSSDPSNHAYVFCGKQYVAIEYSPGDTILRQGVLNISDHWKSLKQANFDHVDAVMLVPGKTDEAFFFCGEHYCRVKFSVGSNANDELLEGPNPIHIRLSASLTILVRSVDTILPFHGGEQNAYIFSGDQYFAFKPVPGNKFEMISGPSSATRWQSLQKAGFY